MKRSYRVLWAVAALLGLAGCDNLKKPETVVPRRGAPTSPPVARPEGKPPESKQPDGRRDAKGPAPPPREGRGKPPEGKAAAKTESDAKDAATEATTSEAPPPPAKPVAYDASRDVSLALDNVLEMERLLNRGRFTQMRPYLDELYSIIGYLEARQPRPLVQLTVRRATFLIRKPDLKAAAGEIARAQQELGMMTGPSAKEMSALLDPAAAALGRNDRQGAEKALAQIHLEEMPGDLAAAAREVRSALASIDLDIARQSARLLSLELKDLTDAINKVNAALKTPAKAAATPAAEPGKTEQPKKQ